MTTNEKPTFWVRDIPIYGDVLLSPMAGYSDIPYRALCRAYGSAMHYTEFVPVESLLGRPTPHWSRLDFKPDESPKIFQIFGNNAQLILQAAQRIEEWEPDIIDINMGCSTRRVSGRGAGVGMMLQPLLVAETFRLLTHHLRVPVTGKIRLGWDDDQKNYLEIAHILEDNGASLVALHARTKMQKYTEPAAWEHIAALKQAVKIPVIGNGDVQVPEDIDRLKAQTGCDGVMIGRAAIGNPWIFARLDRRQLFFADVVTAVRLHLSEVMAYYGEKAGMPLFRKHLKRYLEGITAVQPLLPAMLQATEQVVLEQLLTEAETAVPASLPLSELQPEVVSDEWKTCEVS